jgi:hypothetical protein
MPTVLRHAFLKMRIILSRRSLRPMASVKATKNNKVRNRAMGFAVMWWAVLDIRLCTDANMAEARLDIPGGGVCDFLAGDC